MILLFIHFSKEFLAEMSLYEGQRMNFGCWATESRKCGATENALHFRLTGQDSPLSTSIERRTKLFETTMPEGKQCFVDKRVNLALSCCRKLTEQFLYEIAELHFMINFVTINKYTRMQGEVFKTAWLGLRVFWNVKFCRWLNCFQSFKES
jgi:hypothetical protein